MTDERTNNPMEPGWHLRATGQADELRSLYQRLDELEAAVQDLQKT